MTSVKLEGANHFVRAPGLPPLYFMMLKRYEQVHWDEPERTLVAFLTDAVERY